MAAIKFAIPPVTLLRPLKLALAGKTDSGKTYTLLKFAQAMGGRWSFLDTEGGRVEEYKKDFSLDKWCDRAFLDKEQKFDADSYIAAIAEAERAKYVGLIIDGLSPFWCGVLDTVENLAEELARKYDKDSPMFINAWAGKKGGNRPFYAVMNEILDSRIHVFSTMRARQEFGKVNGKLSATGEWEPDFRKGSHYEMTLFGWMERSKDGKTRNLSFEKTSTCHALEGVVFENPGDDVMNIIKKWRGLR